MSSGTTLAPFGAGMEFGFDPGFPTSLTPGLKDEEIGKCRGTEVSLPFSGKLAQF